MVGGARGVLVAATPQKSAKRAWPEAACRWAAGNRQIIEGVIWQLKDIFGLERPGKNLEWTANPTGGQGRRIHLRAGAQRGTGSSATQPGLSTGLSNCTSPV